MRKFAESFYKSTAWQRCREAAISRDHHLCQDCLKKGFIVPAEEVHHIEPLTPENIDRADISLSLDNLVSLCKECHKARHKTQKRYRVDEYGRVTVR